MGRADGDGIEIKASDNRFRPAILKLEAGAQVTIEVTNRGAQPHNFVIDEVDLSTGTIESGEVATATFTVPDTEVGFVCTFHPGMEGKIQLATD